VARHSEIVAAAGMLSRTTGDVVSVLRGREAKTDEQNTKIASNISSMGHTSITEHDYLLFAIKNVSLIVEQVLIEERFASFTIKSRREADHRAAGFYVPDFHYPDGSLVKHNSSLKGEFKVHQNEINDDYSKLIDQGIIKEDARFIMPYSTYSNIQMGFDAHTLRDTIIKFTKTKYALIPELRVVGEKLYEIAKVYAKYLIPSIDAIEPNYEDAVDMYLEGQIAREPYQVIDKVKLTNKTQNVDNYILISAIMRRYQYPFKKAKQVYYDLCKQNPNFKEELMRAITFNGDREELAQVNFDFQIPASLAILTHYTRHRTHKPLIPDFTPNIDLTQYKTPPKIVASHRQQEFNETYARNIEMYKYFKSLGIRDEDLVYFALAGNLVNFETNMDGKTIEHILRLRECNKAQWETRDIANGIHSEIAKCKDAQVFSSVLGPTCETQTICNEGKECCGKVFQLQKLKQQGVQK